MDQLCPTCKFPFRYEDIESSFRHCSEFCARATEKELTEFRAARSGEFCVFPCSECGEPTEGEWMPGAHCYSCAPKVKLREREALLKECLPHLPSELRARIEEALKSSANPRRSR
jgi:hypothetical protein